MNDYELKQKIKTAGADWIAQQNFWLFGTARYYDGTQVQREDAVRDAKHFFNTIDKQILARRDYNEGRRLQRLVFIETGKYRINTHLHFFIKGTNLAHYRLIKNTCETNWRRHIERAGDCVVLDNLNLQHERKHYCWKEFDCLGSETLLLECCHLVAPLYHKSQ